MSDRNRLLIPSCCLLMVMMSVAFYLCTAAENYERFYGDYVGEAISETAGEIE